jgi:hypothetical protein
MLRATLAGSRSSGDAGFFSGGMAVLPSPLINRLHPISSTTPRTDQSKGMRQIRGLRDFWNFKKEG